MFSNNRTDTIAYFCVWADSARDRSYLKEALRSCGAAVERCVEQDLRTCQETQAALNWLTGNGHRSAVIKFRRAFTLHNPLDREAAASQALAYLARQASRQSRPTT